MNHNQEKQTEAMLSKTNDIFFIIKYHSYEEYKKVIPDVDINICDEYGYNLLQIAIAEWKDDIAMDLIQRGIDIDYRTPKGGDTALHFCMSFKNDKIAEVLLQRNAKVNFYDKYGNEPLWDAVRHQNYELAKLFVEHGADINHKNKNNISPLDLAKRMNYVKMIDILMSHKADK